MSLSRLWLRPVSLILAGVALFAVLATGARPVIAATPPLTAVVDNAFHKLDPRMPANPVRRMKGTLIPVPDWPAWRLD